jgi:glycosyltransferase involved in cell wall biosynthesis
MKVLLVTNFAPDRQESMLRFARLLKSGLPTHGITVQTLAPSPCLTRRLGDYRYAGWRKYVGYLDKFVLFPAKLRAAIRVHQPDVVHILDHANSAYQRAASGVPVLITCHDLLQIRAARGEFAAHHPGRGGRLFQAWILHQLGRGAFFACVSRATAADLRRLVPAATTRLKVIPNGLNHPYAPMPPDQASRRLLALPGGAALLASPTGFYLNVGGGQWYKNRAGLLAIFAALRDQLTPAPLFALVGKPLSAADAARADALGLTDSLRHFSDLAPADLAAAYRLAAGLIFPSWAEGFGWPIAEAQACGCPVFTSRSAPMTEVGGPAAVYFDPSDAPDAAHRIGAARPRAAAMRIAGLGHAARWSAPRMLSAYARLYQRLAAPRP